ncbi:MAG: hypothetical protein JXQ73_32470 [Phycisphaerae bacterium]|nr:hypothetical protein [Phycisphaerae bacterium]
MIRRILSLSVLLWTTTACAEQLLREVQWAPLIDGETGVIVTNNTDAAKGGVYVRNPSPRSVTVPLATLSDLGITSDRYALRGEVRYKGVEGDAYLEMWSRFDDGKKFFTRTLGPGPMAPITGSSGWRAFVLPFCNKQDAPTPSALEINLVLPGSGEVWIAPPTLAQFGPNEDPTAVAGQWWSGATAGLIGGILGIAFGCIGSLIGILASRGRARGFVMGLLSAIQVIGVLVLIGGVVALIKSQPYAVYYPLLLLGILCSALGRGLAPTIRRRYDELELRKITAMDTV